MKLTKPMKEYLEVMLKELEDQGITKHEIEFKGSHPCLIFWIGEERGRISFPASPSDVRGRLAARTSLRRKIQEVRERVNG